VARGDGIRWWQVVVQTNGGGGDFQGVVVNTCRGLPVVRLSVVPGKRDFCQLANRS
jgi:hypothetical protein